MDKRIFYKKPKSALLSVNGEANRRRFEDEYNMQLYIRMHSVPNTTFSL